MADAYFDKSELRDFLKGYKPEREKGALEARRGFFE